MVSAPFLRCGSCEWELGLRERKVCVAFSFQSPTNSPLVLPGLSGFCFPCLIRSPTQWILFIWQRPVLEVRGLCLRESPSCLGSLEPSGETGLINKCQNKLLSKNFSQLRALFRGQVH